MKELDEHLLESVEADNIDAVKKYLEKGADINAAWEDHDSNTPLICAAYNGSTDMVSFLIEHGANIEGKNNEGWTAIMLASMYGYDEVVKLLLDACADINQMDIDGKTALDWAEENDHHEVVSMIKSFVENKMLSDSIDTNKSEKYPISF